MILVWNEWGVRLPKPPRVPDAKLGIRLFITKHPMLTQAILETPLGDRADRIISLAMLGLFAERNAGAAHGPLLIPALPQQVDYLSRHGEPIADTPPARLRQEFTQALVEQLEE